MLTLDEYGYLDLYDILLPPFYIAVILYITSYIKRRNIKSSEDFKYLVPGMLAKIFGAVFFTAFYIFYYGGADSGNYYMTSRSLLELMTSYPLYFVEVYLQKPSENFMMYYFDPDLTIPVYWSRDEYAFFVSKIASVFQLIGFKSFLCVAITLSCVAFIGSWKLFRILCAEFPHLRREMAISIFFVPSIVFWTSGLLKDTVILAAVCWFVHGFYNFFIKKRFKWYYLVSMFIAAYFQISIKPYVLFALLPGSLVWLSINLLAKYSPGTFKTVLTILLVGLGAGLGYLVLDLMSENLGLYSLDNVIERAGAVQHDLQQSYYGGKSFNIGTYEQTVAGVISVAHLAIFAGLFRPTMLDVQNVVMFISALENTVVMLFFLRIIWNYKVIKILKPFNYSSLLTFMFLFAVFFSFSVGLSISNFGSLVRLKSPAIPFFVASLFIMRDYYLQLKTKRLI